MTETVLLQEDNFLKLHNHMVKQRSIVQQTLDKVRYSLFGVELHRTNCQHSFFILFRNSLLEDFKDGYSTFLLQTTRLQPHPKY